MVYPMPSCKDQGLVKKRPSRQPSVLTGCLTPQSSCEVEAEGVSSPPDTTWKRRQAEQDGLESGHLQSSSDQRIPFWEVNLADIALAILGSSTH